MLQQKAPPKGKRHRGDGERLKAIEESYKKQIDTLQDDIERKDVELVTLRQTCTRLQQQRQTMLADAHLKEEIHHRETESVSDKNLLKSPKSHPRIEQLERENSELKYRISALSLDIEQQKVRFQASLAESERTVRQTHEDTADRIEKLRAQQKEDLDRVKAEYALSHSTSKVAELKSRVAGQDVVIQKLKDKLASNAVTAEALAASKVSDLILLMQHNLQGCCVKWPVYNSIINSSFKIKYIFLNANAVLHYLQLCVLLKVRLLALFHWYL